MPRPRIERLEWDAWNRDHITKHAVTQHEVEEAVAGPVVSRVTYKGRFQLIGPTSAGRMLAIIVGPVPHQVGIYYVFSARPASRKERRFYDDQQGATQG